MTYDIPLDRAGLSAAKKFFAEAKQLRRKSRVPFGLRRAQHANSLSKDYIMASLIVTKLDIDHVNKVMIAEVSV